MKSLNKNLTSVPSKRKRLTQFVLSFKKGMVINDRTPNVVESILSVCMNSLGFFFGGGGVVHGFLSKDCVGSHPLINVNLNQTK